jgi:hypothetical protein
MKLLSILKTIVLEAKQAGDLYHFTPVSYLKDILLTQYLYPNDENQISTSRRPNMSTQDFQDMKTNSIARIMLDGDKISNKYKVRPFAFGANENDPEDLGEEQIVVNGQKFPFIPYLKRIDIFLNKKTKVNDKIIELLEKANIPYKIYPNIPISNIPYIQPKNNKPEDINISNIPKREIYNELELYFPGMKTKKIPYYRAYNDGNNENNYLVNMNVGISPEYPDHYLGLTFFSHSKYLKDHWYNKNGEKINNLKIIPIPMYKDPKWLKKWEKNVQKPYTNLSYDSYLLIPKKEVDVE